MGETPRDFFPSITIYLSNYCLTIGAGNVPLHERLLLLKNKEFYSCGKDTNNYVGGNYFGAVALLVVSDYNWFRGKKISIFAGLGMGLANTKVIDPEPSLCVMPRAGAEFFNRLRLTVDYKWLPDGYY